MTQAGDLDLPAHVAALVALDETIVHGLEFDPPVKVSREASALDQLLGLTGRHPTWTAGVGRRANG
jgi:hypothetical protein